MTDNPKAMVPKSGGGSGPNTEQGAQPAENVRKQINKNRKPGMSAASTFNDEISVIICCGNYLSRSAGEHTGGVVVT